MAETLLFGGKNRDAGSGDKVTMAYRYWIDKLTRALTTAVPGVSYIKVHSDNLVGLMTCIFVKSTEKPNLRGLDITSVKRYVIYHCYTDSQGYRWNLRKQGSHRR
jgi:hypothetical protein